MSEFLNPEFYYKEMLKFQNETTIKIDNYLPTTSIVFHTNVNIDIYILTSLLCIVVNCQYPYSMRAGILWVFCWPWCTLSSVGWMHHRWSSILYYFWSYLTFFSLIRCWSVEISKGWKLSLAQWESLLLLLMWRFACPLTLTHTPLNVIIPCYLYLKFYAKREMGEKGWLTTLWLLLQTPAVCHEFWAFYFQKYPEDILLIEPFFRWVCR